MSVFKTKAIGGESSPGVEGRETDLSGVLQASLICKRCRATCAGDRKFCRECGSSLWESCPRCSQPVASGERFCGECGACVEDQRNAAISELQLAMDQARTLLAESRFGDAMRALRMALRSPGEQIQSLVAEANQLRDRIVAESQRAEQAAAAAYEEARELVQQSRYFDALHVASSIPDPVCGNELRELRDQARAVTQEIDFLVIQSQEAIASNRLISALTTLQRLSALCPTDEKYIVLINQVSSRVLEGAKKLIGEYRFADAVKLVDCIPDFAQSDESRKLIDQVREVHWHLEQLRLAPLLTPELISIGDRLKRMLPKSDVAARFSVELSARASESPKTAGGIFPEWATSPQLSPLGIPVDWMCDMPKPAAANQELLSQLRRHPGRFFVATGLALQALEKASMSLQLMPDTRASLLGGLAKGLRRTAASAWGIELGATALKAVRLLSDDNNNVIIDRAEIIDFELSAKAASSTGGSFSIEMYLEEFLRRHDLKGSRVAVNLPGLNVLSRFLTLPAVVDKKKQSLLALEAKHQIPFPIEECIWDTAPIDSGSVAAAGSMTRYVLLACKRQVIDDRLRLFKQAGIKVDLVQCDTVALHNYASYLRQQAILPHDRPTVWMDIGAEGSKIVASGPQTLWFRTLPTGALDITRALSRDLKMTFADAHAVKLQPSKARRLCHFDRAIVPVFQRLLDDFRRSLEHLHSLYPTEEPVHAYLCGGGASTYGLLRHFKVG